MIGHACSMFREPSPRAYTAFLCSTASLRLIVGWICGVEFALPWLDVRAGGFLVSRRCRLSVASRNAQLARTRYRGGGI